MLKFHRELIEKCSAIGISARVEYGGKHPKLVCEHDGGRFAIPVSLSPSDQRFAARNVIGDVRRQMKKGRPSRAAP